VGAFILFGKNPAFIPPLASASEASRWKKDYIQPANYPTLPCGIEPFVTAPVDVWQSLNLAVETPAAMVDERPVRPQIFRVAGSDRLSGFMRMNDSR
jgi:hypothetical protein